MDDKVLKYRVVNDWSGLTGVAGFVCVLASGFSLFSGELLTSIGLFIVGFGILTKAVETVIDIEAKTIEQFDSVFLILKANNRNKYAANDFDTVRLYLHSEVNKHIGRVNTATSRVREYNVDLYAPKSNEVFSVAVFTDYKMARKVVYTLAKNWKYIPEDEVALKMARNKKDTEERLRKRKFK